MQRGQLEHQRRRFNQKKKKVQYFMTDKGPMLVEEFNEMDGCTRTDEELYTSTNAEFLDKKTHWRQANTLVEVVTSGDKYEIYKAETHGSREHLAIETMSLRKMYSYNFASNRRKLEKTKVGDVHSGHIIPSEESTPPDHATAVAHASNPSSLLSALEASLSAENCMEIESPNTPSAFIASASSTPAAIPVGAKITNSQPVSLQSY
jgi:hypothetical protein